MQGRDLYDHPEECRYLLWSYEEHLARKAGAPIDEDVKAKIWRLRAADSIEHIFPQNYSAIAWRDKMIRAANTRRAIAEQNVDRIGNLILLPLSMNQAARDSSFEEKKRIYARHNLRMIQEVCQESDWALSEIEQREARIVTWAKTRWSDL